MTYLSADQILSADDLEVEDVEVPEWGGTVRVRGMSAAERDRFESSFMDSKGRTLPAAKAMENYRARLAAASMVDADGKRLFRSEAEVKRLGERSADALTRVCEVASRLSALSEDDQDDLLGN